MHRRRPVPSSVLLVVLATGCNVTTNRTTSEDGGDDATAGATTPDAGSTCTLLDGACPVTCFALSAYPIDLVEKCALPGYPVACATTYTGGEALTCAVEADGGLWAFTTTQLPTGTDFSACNAAETSEVNAITSACDGGSD